MTRPRKRFGQNFLRDDNVIRRIIGAINPQADDHFVEIGPGEGAITRVLRSGIRRLDVVEIDRDLAAKLQEEVEPGVFDVHCIDALKFDFASIADGPLRMAGNLPYNISTPLLFHLLSFGTVFTDLHLMLQKEVVDRMAAGPGSKTYGRLSVALAARCSVEPLFTIKPGSFFPPPKVMSAFVRVTPLADPLLPDDLQNEFDEVLRQGFSQRRKQLGNGLKTLLTSTQIESAGADPAWRPDRVDPPTWVALARELAASR